MHRPPFPSPANMFRSTAKSIVCSRRPATLATAATMRNNPSRLFYSTPENPSQLIYSVVPKEDFGQYKEYSVIFTNRALNLMSDPFQKVMRDLNDLLKTTYNADKIAIIPG